MPWRHISEYDKPVWPSSPNASGCETPSGQVWHIHWSVVSWSAEKLVLWWLSFSSLWYVAGGPPMSPPPPLVHAVVVFIKLCYNYRNAVHWSCLSSVITTIWPPVVMFVLWSAIANGDWLTLFGRFSPTLPKHGLNRSTMTSWRKTCQSERQFCANWFVDFVNFLWLRFYNRVDHYTFL